MNIKITSDSTCDLSKELVEKNDITVIPLHVIMDGKEYSDGVDLVPTDIFSHVDAGGELASTSATSVGEYAEFFSSLSAEYDAVIHINLGSGFSCCYQNACEAAREFKNVYCVDSQNLSTGNGHIVMEAVRLRESGAEPEAIVAELNDIAPRVETSFILDKLDYMRKGGRCSAVTLLGANMLKIKPCIEVADGKMRVAKKYRGSFDKVLLEYVRDRLSERDDIIYDRIFITYTVTLDPSVANAVDAEVKKLGSFKEVIHTNAGCTVSSHCGHECLGILFIRKPA